MFLLFFCMWLLNWCWLKNNDDVQFIKLLHNYWKLSLNGIETFFEIERSHWLMCFTYEKNIHNTLYDGWKNAVAKPFYFSFIFLVCDCANKRINLKWCWVCANWNLWKHLTHLSLSHHFCYITNWINWKFRCLDIVNIVIAFRKHNFSWKKQEKKIKKLWFRMSCWFPNQFGLNKTEEFPRR